MFFLSILLNLAQDLGQKFRVSECVAGIIFASMASFFRVCCIPAGFHLNTIMAQNSQGSGAEERLGVLSKPINYEIK